MGLRKLLCDSSLAAALVAMAVLLLPGCTATPTAPRTDWRQSVKVGDYKAAFSDLYETWRAGSPDVKAETLRHAWRDPRIVDAARQDALENIQRIASSHKGDLAALERAVKKGEFEDRIEFAKVVDRSLDLDREIRSAYEKRGPAPGAAKPVDPAPPAEKAQPVAKAPPTERSQPTQATKPVETAPSAPIAKPVETAPSAPKAKATETVQPAPKPQPVEKAAPAPKPQVAEKTQPAAKPQPAEKIEPAPNVEMRPAESASITELTAQAAEAKRRAVLRCKGASACDKAMASAQDFVVLNSNMRIQVATDTLIETYKPIEIGHLGMKVLKVPVSGDEAELQLTVSCRVGVLRKLCPASEARVYTAFPVFMQSAIR